MSVKVTFEASHGGVKYKCTTSVPFKAVAGDTKHHSREEIQERIQHYTSSSIAATLARVGGVQSLPNPLKRGRITEADDDDDGGPSSAGPTGMPAGHSRKRARSGRFESMAPPPIKQESVDSSIVSIRFKHLHGSQQRSYYTTRNSPLLPLMEDFATFLGVKLSDLLFSSGDSAILKEDLVGTRNLKNGSVVEVYRRVSAGYADATCYHNVANEDERYSEVVKEEYVDRGGFRMGRYSKSQQLYPPLC